ncbi:hypothetical protein AAULR_20431 [Lacticaseibacillus rhamnosus MTCC 5462]|nr:hypothetical protein AAULR_20431 [Lacticaseibacillus rhamnosus MTCC 5462]
MSVLTNEKAKTAGWLKVDLFLVFLLKMSAGWSMSCKFNNIYIIFTIIKPENLTRGE